MAKKKGTKEPSRRSPAESALVPDGYEELLGQLKERIRTSQLRAALAVNRELVLANARLAAEVAVAYV